MADESGPAARARAVRRGNPVAERRVAEMFDAIAPTYDRLNTLLTAGLDGRWRRAAVKAAGLRSGGSAIDVACGTGKLTAALAARVGPQGRVVGVDLSAEMLALAERRYGGLPQVEFRQANALELPFEPATFDAATIAFGLRNLASFEDGFAALARLVRPGGRVVCLELSMPRPRAFGLAYHGLFRFVAPAAGALFGHRAAYEYLPESLAGFPDPALLAASMRAVGLRRVTVRRLALGAVALHVGEVGQSRRAGSLGSTSFAAAAPSV